MKSSKGSPVSNPIERVAPILEGMTLDEAEEVAVTILSQVMAKRVYIEDRYEEYFEDLMMRICSGADDYASENLSSIAVAKLVLAHEGDDDDFKLN